MSARWHRWARDFDWRSLAVAFDDDQAAAVREAQDRALLSNYERMARVGDLGLTILENQIQKMLDTGDTIPKGEIARLGTFFFKLRREGLLQGEDEGVSTEPWRPDPEDITAIEFHLTQITSTIINVNGESVEPQVDDQQVIEGFARIIEEGEALDAALDPEAALSQPQPSKKRYPRRGPSNRG